ncbi:phosphatidate cytidylyltransferase [Methylobacterium sp. sgz302541]|uniref:phosphatidate cytidylyltransferase n=1 Tax=unclassified Methylobacterium TaxID=2615210 RepID=UPI003D340552
MAPGETAPATRRGPFAGRELGLRVVSGIVLAVVVVAALVAGGWPFALVWLAAGIVGAAEWIGISRTAPERLLTGLVALALVALVVCARTVSPLAGLAALGVGVLAVLIVARGGRGRLRALGGLLGGAVIAVVPSALRDAPGIGIAGPAWMFAVVWSTDVAAYFTGRTLGGPKLMPSVSPKKTWSGAIGGLLAAVAAGTAVVAYARGQGGDLAAVPLVAAALVSGLASVLSQGGDLVESAFKRVYGVKDSGRSIPGHGGVMDRLDGFFAVALLAGLTLALRAAT